MQEVQNANEEERVLRDGCALCLNDLNKSEETIKMWTQWCENELNKLNAEEGTVSGKRTSVAKL